MRRSAALLLCASVILAGQSAGLDEGRLDPSWFGPGVVFQPSKALGFQWLKPGLDLRNRTLRLKAWEPAAWLLGKRAAKDQAFLALVERRLEPTLAAGVRHGLKGTLAVSPTLGDVVLIGRVVDAVGDSDDYMAAGSVLLSLDLKLVDGDTGELLGAFHDTLKGPNPDTLSRQFAPWSEALGRVLATAAPALNAAPSGMVASGSAAAPAPPPFDLEGALRRIEALRRDGLLSDAECEALRQKAREKK